jgi:Na+-translocating ferredoxin:NAD+ oxidoreductase RnfD subunit
MPLVLTFLGTYFALFTASAYASKSLAALNAVAEIFHGPDCQAVLYFAFFMLTDPPTSPPRYREQVYCGVLVAGVSYLCFEWTRAVYYLLAGAVAGNLWEAWRRTRARRTSTTRALTQT